VPEAGRRLCPRRSTGIGTGAVAIARTADAALVRPLICCYGETGIQPPAVADAAIVYPVVPLRYV
jgi:hypothetical protein